MEKSGPVLANALRKGKEGSKDIIHKEVKDYTPDSDIKEVILDDDDDNSESNDAMLQRTADYQTKELNKILNINCNDSRVNGNKYKEVYFEGTFEDYINAEIQAEILRSKKKGSFTHPIFNDKLISVDLNHPSPENENNAADSENGYGISEDISVYDLGLYLRDSEKEHMEYMDKSYPRYFQCAENLIDGKCSVMPYFMRLASGDSGKTRVGFKCFICSKFFFTRNGIMKHLVQHLNTICYFCNKVTKASQKLKRHIMQQHFMQLVNDNIRCKYCEEKFSDFDLYMDHIKAHFNYHCAMCPFESENPNDLVSHISQEHMNYKANCIDCSLFYDDENLKEHLTEVARIGFVCRFCGMAFHNDVFLKIHYEIYGPSHGNGIVNDDEFNSFSHILDIAASEVLNETPTASSSSTPVKADKQKSSTTKKIDIKRVKKIVTEKIQTIIPQPQASSSSQSQYTCEYCLKPFGRKENLIRHVRSHTGETPYQCQLCNKAFARSDQLNVHMRGHKGHNIAFKCVICSKQFASRPSLNGHLRIHRNVHS